MAKERVLVVDDEKDFVDVISERLGAKGFDIIRAFDGKEGMEKALSYKPDLIILDIMMPEMNGYDVCRKLKLDENLKDTPIIMLTAKFQPNDIRFGMDMGADAYLTKPLELELLLNTVNALLEARKKRSPAIEAKPRSEIKKSFYMKTLITYYSFSGNTDKVANIFAEALRKKGDVVLQRLKPADEIKNFALQCKAAFTGKRAILEGDPQFDLGQYDLLLIGTPVWAFAPTPSINTYLDKLSGLSGKAVIIFLTSGSGTGVGRCFKNIRKVLESKGSVKVDEVNIPDRKQDDKEFIVSSLEKVL